MNKRKVLTDVENMVINAQENLCLTQKIAQNWRSANVVNK
jgi:hypothetical protein